MPGKVILITGIPASGKTTLTRELVNLALSTISIGFGETLFKIKRENGSEQSYAALRGKPTVSAPATLVRQTREEVGRMIQEASVTSNVILDSHAVVNDNYGFRMISDVSVAILDAVLVLQTDYKTVAERISRNADGRHILTQERLNTYQELQNAAAVAYGISMGCPIYFIDATDSLSLSLRYALQVFDDIGLEYQSVTSTSRSQGDSLVQ